MEWAEFEAVFNYLSQAMTAGKEVRLYEAGKINCHNIVFQDPEGGTAQSRTVVCHVAGNFACFRNPCRHFCGCCSVMKVKSEKHNQTGLERRRSSHKMGFPIRTFNLRSLRRSFLTTLSFPLRSSARKDSHCSLSCS